MTAEPQTTQLSVRSEDGTPIGVEVVGSGAPLVVVHGSWANSARWLGPAALLSEHRTCYVLDRRARNRSGDGADYSFEREAEDISAVLAAAGPGSALMGHSAGAIYALEAARSSALVERLVLYEPPLHGFGPGNDYRAILDRMRARVDEARPEEAATIFFEEEARAPSDELAQLRSSPAWAAMVALAATTVREHEALFAAEPTVERYRDVSVPTLLIAGSETRDHPSFATRDLAEVLPDARVAVLEGQGHFAHRGAPEALAREILGFLDADRS